jgi:DNA-binding Xre family transcriptional regulator
MSNNNLLSLQEIQDLLQDKKLYVITKATGLSYPTLKKLADGKPENYTSRTLSKVSDYLKPKKNTENSAV